MTRCILPNCKGETTPKAKFCLDCMTAISNEKRGRVLYFYGKREGTQNQQEWHRHNRMFLKLADQAHRISQAIWAHREKQNAAKSVGRVS